jgi:hypothetical protein
VTGTVLVLADDDPRCAPWRAALLASVPGAIVVEPVDGPEAALAARTCAAINVLTPDAPLVVVALATAARLLPAVALSQRAAHRRVAEYLLVDPALPPVTEGWPDAPVTVLCDDEAGDASLQGRLRAWTVLSTTALADWRPTP